MRKGMFLLGILGTMVACLFYAGVGSVWAQSSNHAALAGQVSSSEEGPMEGVLVAAKGEGSTITVTVVSDAKGHYSFPQDRLQPGQYSLRIRAVGYDLENSGQVDVAAGKTTQLDLKLDKTKDLASQLSNAEWLISMPGTREQKIQLYECSRCHSLQRIVRSQKDVDEWEATIRRMSYYVGSTPLKPQRRPADPPEVAAVEAERRRVENEDRQNRFVAAGGVLPQGRPQQDAGGGDDMAGGEGGGDPGGAGRHRLAEFLATVNLSKGPTWSYELKTLPRPSGRGTRVIYTTYDLPRKVTMIHDCAVGPDGMIWYTDFGSQFVGKLDPKTGKVTEYPVPILKPGYPEGLMDIRFDKEGNVWMGMMAQGGIAKFDKTTQKVITYKIPAPGDIPAIQIAMVMPNSSNVDGKVWTNNVGLGGIERLDVNTGKIETIFLYRNYTKDPRRHGTYGINADAQNNLYVNDISSDMVVKIDAKTLESKFYETPTPNSGPRRGRMDAQFRLWLAESRADKIAMFDPETERFQEWPSPTPFSQIYDVTRDKYGDVWSGGVTSDFIYRLKPDTSQFTQYLLPKLAYDVRRVDVDSSTNPPTFWVGDDNSAIITKLEPLD